MAAVSWYGPLIDLAAASTHIGDFVQLLVFVHRSTPVQYKLSKSDRRAETVMRTDVRVGDETRSFFSVSLWGKQMASLVSAGDVVLLQNVKITTFANVIEAKTVHCSAVLTLAHINKNGSDHLLGSCRVGKTVKDKLEKVIEWVLKSGSATHVGQKGHQYTGAPRNWKMTEKRTPRKCYTLSEVSHLATSSTTIFQASLGEIFLPSAWQEFERDRMFISRRLVDQRDSIVEDMICTGCQICGFPLGLEPVPEQQGGSLYCEKSSNHFHSVGSIYRSFMLYVWDDSEYLPLLVTNRAAEILFADIKADKVLQSYKEHKKSQNGYIHLAARISPQNGTHEKAVNSCSSHTGGDRELKSHDSKDKLNVYLIWLILLKLLLQGKNSPLEFEVHINPNKEVEDGRFEMISVVLPCITTL